MRKNLIDFYPPLDDLNQLFNSLTINLIPTLTPFPNLDHRKHYVLVNIRDRLAFRVVD
jgi:hypothetical protein